MADHTRRQLTALCADPPHAMLLAGPTGIGKRTVAQAVAARITAPACISVIEPDDKHTISIDAIRELYPRTRGKQRERQVIIIDHGESMSQEAQNAFLKLLEEPRSGITFIVTSPAEDSLLPTIISRLQTVPILRITQGEAQKILKGRRADLQQHEAARILFIADGRPGKLICLLEEPDTLATETERMKQAKDMLTGTAYERLSLVNTLAKNREHALALVEAMAVMVYSRLVRDPDPRLLALADGLQQCMTRLAQNGNPRAQLTYLFMSQ